MNAKQFDALRAWPSFSRTTCPVTSASAAHSTRSTRPACNAWFALVGRSPNLWRPALLPGADDFVHDRIRHDAGQRHHHTLVWRDLNAISAAICSGRITKTATKSPGKSKVNRLVRLQSGKVEMNRRCSDRAPGAAVANLLLFGGHGAFCQDLPRSRHLPNRLHACLNTVSDAARSQDSGGCRSCVSGGVRGPLRHS